MKHPSEEILALYAGGDLVDGDVAGHVGACGACRKVVEEFEQVRELCRGLDEPVPGRRKQKISPWNWGLAAAASVAVLSLLLWPREEQIVTPSTKLAIAAVPTEPVLTSVAEKPKLGRRFSAPKPKYTLVSDNELRIDTPDPSVIVLVQLKGETQTP